MSMQAVEGRAGSKVPEPGVFEGDIPWKDAPRIVGSGLAMGTADVVPGVSGGTMAVACGIYMELLGAINSVNGRALRALSRFDLRAFFGMLHWRFLACLLLGIGLAFVVMLKIVGLPRLLVERPTEVYAVFFGLVLASVFVLARRVSRWTIGRAGMLLLGAALGLGIVSLVPVTTPESSLFLFFCGAVAICAMILPGISGSFVLLILGKYEYVIGAVERLMHLDISALGVVLPFVLGCVVGLATFSRVLTWLLSRWQEPMLVFLTGLLVGSLWRIWPFQDVTQQMVRGKLKVVSATPMWPEHFDGLVLALIVSGLLAVTCIEIVAARRRAIQ